MRQPPASLAPPEVRVTQSGKVKEPENSHGSVIPLQDKQETPTSLDARGVKPYIEHELRYGNDASARTVYFIFQRHGISREVVTTQSAVNIAKDAAATCQLAVYRILERLHESSGVYVVERKASNFVQA